MCRVALLLAAAAIAAPGPALAAGPAGPRVTTVVTQFVPEAIATPRGTPVEWTNPDPIGYTSHTVTTDVQCGVPRCFDASLPLGATFALDTAALAPGAYPYYCRPHRGLGMQGVLVVLPVPVAPFGITVARSRAQTPHGCVLGRPRTSWYAGSLRPCPATFGLRDRINVIPNWTT